MKRRNVYNFIATNKLRRALKRNKTNDGVGFIVRLFGGIGMLILFDFLSDLRVELLYPFYLFVSEFNDIFRFKGFLYLLCYMFLALSVDMLCYYFLTIQWLLFTSSSIVWFQFTWDSDRGYLSSSFLPVWLTLCGFEFFIRGRQIKTGYSITQEISRPFAAHGVGHSIFMLCFFCKNFIFYRIKIFRCRGIRRENDALMALMRSALSTPPRTACSTDKKQPLLLDRGTILNSTSAHITEDILSNGQTLVSNGIENHKQSPALLMHTARENGNHSSFGASHKQQNGSSLSSSSCASSSSATKLISSQSHSSQTISSPSTSALTISLTNSTTHSSQSFSSLFSSSIITSSSISSNLTSGALVTSSRRSSNRTIVSDAFLLTRILVFIKKPLLYYDSLEISKTITSFTIKTIQITGIYSLSSRLIDCTALVLSSFRVSIRKMSSLHLKDASKTMPEKSSSEALNSSISSNGTLSALDHSSNISANMSISQSSSINNSIQQCNGCQSLSFPVNEVQQLYTSSSSSSSNKRKNSLENNNTKQKQNRQTSKGKGSSGSLQALLNNQIITSTNGVNDTEMLQHWEALIKSKEDQITSLKYQNNKLKCDVEITQQARDDLVVRVKNVEKSEKAIEKRLKNAQNEIQTLQKRVQTMNQYKQQDKQTIQKLEKSLEDECKRHKITAEQQSQAEARAASALESFNKANSSAETWKNKCRDSSNQQRRDFELNIFSLQQELARRKERDAHQEQIIKDLKERINRFNLLGNAYQEKTVTLEKQLSCVNNENYELKLILTDRENEVLELRSKLLRYTSNINNKTFVAGNGFASNADFEQQITTNRDLVNRCFSSCSPANSSTQAQRALSPSAFSSPTPPMSMLGPLSVQNISPGSGNANKLNTSSSAFHHHLSAGADSEDLIRNPFRLSREASLWPQSGTPTGSGPVTGAGNSTVSCNSSTIIRLCDSSNLGAVGSERESANGRHSSQSNCSINNRINGSVVSSAILNNGFATSGPGVLNTSTSSSSSPLGASTITGNGLAAVGQLSTQIGSSKVMKVYDDFFSEDSVFDLPTVSNNSQGGFF